MCKMIRPLFFAGVLCFAHGTPSLALPTLHYIEWSLGGNAMIAVSDTQVQVFNSSGTLITALVLPASPTEVHVSPDGSHIAYAVASNQIWIQNLATLTKAQIFSTGGNMQSCSDLRWFPGGQSLLYTVTSFNPSARSDVHMVQADGTGDKIILSYSP